VSACVLNATVIFNNLGETGAGQITAYMFFNEAQQFIAPAAGTLQSVIFDMRYTGESYGMLTVEVRPDVGGVPDSSQLGILDPDQSIYTMTTLSDWGFHPDSTISLAAGTAYWVTMSGASNGSAEWEFTNSTSGTGYPFTSWHADKSFATGWAWVARNDGSPMMMQVNEGVGGGAGARDFPAGGALGSCRACRSTQAVAIVSLARISHTPRPGLSAKGRKPRD
jgi:hypothetical protein